MSLIPVAEAQARILALAPPLAVETVKLAAAAGRWAVEDVLARRTQPAADLSAMDGYAIRFDALPGPWRVVGESAAGRGLGRPLAAGEAARIFTGAPVPAGADTILIQEEARRQGDALDLDGPGPGHPGAFVRRVGSDFAGGDRLISAGDRLTAPRIALAAIGGHGALAVRRRPRVALISTGDELVPPGNEVDGVALPASNAPMLAALLRELPVEVLDLGIVRDDLATLTGALTEASAVADIVVATGGASVGDHDLIRPALAAAGASLDFWRVAMKPGKPLLAGRLGDAAVLGLPGNPVSAFVTALLFLLPLVRHAMGASEPHSPLRVARLAGPLPAAGERMEFVRARLDRDLYPLAEQDSAVLRALADADALIVRPPRAGPAAAGDDAQFIALA